MLLQPYATNTLLSPPKPLNSRGGEDVLSAACLGIPRFFGHNTTVFRKAVKFLRLPGSLSDGFSIIDYYVIYWTNNAWKLLF